MDQDLLDLLTAWGSGGLDDSRRAELLARLRSNEAFRREFVGELHMLGSLKAVQATEPRWLLLEDELGWSADQRASGSPLDDRVMQDIRQLARSRTLRRWKWGGLAAAMVLVALLSFFWPRGRYEPPPALTLPPAPAPYVAVVVRLDGAQWEPAEGPPPSEGNPLPAGALQLRSGRATLTFFSGVMLSVQGPADLNLLSAERMFCRQGKLRARVPPGAEGFAVLAPGAAVVDMGTEFGLNVAADGKTQCMVFAGKAEVSILNAEGHTLRSELLVEQKAAELDPGAGRIDEMTPAPDTFVAAPGLIPPSLTLDPAYPVEIGKSQPWGYWRFESLTGGSVPNTIPQRPPLRAVGPIELAGVAGDNRSVAFQTTSSDQYLIMEGSWTPPRASGYAVELWALSEELSASTLLNLASRAREPLEKQIFILELTGRSHHLLHDPCRVRFLDRWPPRGIGGTNVFSQTMYIPYRWHHLVAQKTRDRLELYVDGELSGATQADLAPETTACRLAVGRLKLEPQTDLYQVRPFVGRLDELALYEHPLSGAEIRRHYELGTSGSFGSARE